MKRNLVYGSYDARMEYGQFIEVFLGVEQERHLGVRWKDHGDVTVFHFLIKDVADYYDFVDELEAALRDCESIGEAYYALEAYLDSEYADEWLEEYPEVNDAAEEFESRDLTAKDYLSARDLMIGERNMVWEIYEDNDFHDDRCAQLIEAYDLVIDGLTCLAMECDKQQ